MRHGTLEATALVLAVFMGLPIIAAEPTPPRSTLTQPRTGTTNKFGSGTITNRSDGTRSQTRPFGSGSITAERTKDGRNVTGQTQKFGSGTITRWSNGTTTQTRPFGSGVMTTERGRGEHSDVKKPSPQAGILSPPAGSFSLAIGRCGAQAERAWSFA
jgi:hypothetical protein